MYFSFKGVLSLKLASKLELKRRNSLYNTARSNSLPELLQLLLMNRRLSRK